jgi:type II secretory ATPase GspE/PulE/Tfp pilus assembly ATPase PilB-like protein
MPNKAMSRFQTEAVINTLEYVEISTHETLRQLSPAFVRSLAHELAVLSLRGRVCPVGFSDGSVGVFTLLEYCHDDQTRAVLELLKRRGLRLSQPQLFVLPPALLLAIDKSADEQNAALIGAYPDRQAQQGALSAAFDALLRWGVVRRASDIHFNVNRNRYSSPVFFTLAGRYVSPSEFSSLPTSTVLDMLAVAWMDIEGGNGAVFDPMIEQQGRLSRLVDGQKLLLRWASLATDVGPSVCLRLLVMDESKLTPDLHELGYLPEQIALFERLSLTDGGAVVLAGTVGSGKSTTIATLMRAIAPDRKVITLEDPAEYLIPNALQNTVCRSFSEQDDHAFDSKLKAIKRSAMNDLLIGEIRDHTTGRAFMDLAACGVNLYTTVHAGSALLIPDRLASSFIGVARDLLATPGILKLLVFQALMLKLCPRCSLTFDQARVQPQWRCALGQVRTQAWLDSWVSGLEVSLGLSRSILRFRNEQACLDCDHSISSLRGTAGRTVVAEMIDPVREPEFLEGVKNKDGVGLYQWFTQRNQQALLLAEPQRQSAQQIAIYKMAQGLLDPRDVQARFGDFDVLQAQRGVVRA